jgi:dihydroneopterin aldolase|tara:strand:- start:43 stop:447 length:405 start_codon:yes stop_codon:yes gene_type:complete
MGLYSDEKGHFEGENESGMTVIFLRELFREVDIGIHAHEIGKPQKLRFDIEAVILGSEPPESDKISDVVNYEYLMDAIEDSIGGKRVSLLESLGSRILERLLRPPQVSEATIKITKMDILEGDAKFGCQMSRKR